MPLKPLVAFGVTPVSVAKFAPAIRLTLAPFCTIKLSPLLNVILLPACNVMLVGADPDETVHVPASVMFCDACRSMVEKELSELIFNVNVPVVGGSPSLTVPDAAVEPIDV